MKKSLAAFIIANTKNNVLFESRLSHIFANDFGGELALEQLAYGTPVGMEYSNEKIAEWLSNPEMKVTKITGVSLNADGRIHINWEGEWLRYFRTEEDAKTSRRWDGLSQKREGYNVEAWIPGEDNHTFEDVPDEIVHIIRDVDNL